MRTPVIIAAYNEAAYIGRTLNHLDTSIVEPIVVVNGERQDDTAGIAASYEGVTVMIREEQGQLPAIQHAITRLGERALEPILLLDADSYPLFPRQWPKRMLNHLQRDEPSVVSGSMVLRDGPFLDVAGYSMKWLLDDERARRAMRIRSHGANMAIHLRTDAARKAICELPHIWRGNDRSITGVILRHEGTAVQSTDPRAFVVTSARYLEPLITAALSRTSTRLRRLEQSYRRRSAPSVQFNYDTQGELVSVSAPMLH